MPHTSTQIQGTNLDLRHLLARSKCASKCHASSSYEYPACTQSHLGLAMQAWRLLWNLPLQRGHCRSKEMKRWCNIPYLVRHFKTWKAVASALTLLSGPGTEDRRTLSWEPDRLQGNPFQMSAHRLGDHSGGASSGTLPQEPWYVQQSV